MTSSKIKLVLLVSPEYQQRGNSRSDHHDHGERHGERTIKAMPEDIQHHTPTTRILSRRSGGRAGAGLEAVGLVHEHNFGNGSKVTRRSEFGEKKLRCGRGWWRPSPWPRRLAPSRGAAVVLQLRRRQAPRSPR